MTLFTETFIAVTLILGLLTRLGAFVCARNGGQYTIGISRTFRRVGLDLHDAHHAGRSVPAHRAGRSFGVDAFLGPRLEQAGARAIASPGSSPG